MRTALLGLWVSMASGSPPAAAGSERCVEAFAGQLQRLESNRERSLAVSALHRTACRSGNFNLSGGFDSRSKAIVEGVPVLNRTLANLGISNNRQLCEAVQDGRLALAASDTEVREPVVAAMEQLNTCFRILERSGGVTITHKSPHPGEVAFNVDFGGIRHRLFLSVGASGGFRCLMPRVGQSPQRLDADEQVELKENATIRCTRGEGRRPRNGDAEFPFGHVTLLNTDELYVVPVEPDAIMGPSSRNQAQARYAAMSRLAEAGRRDLEQIKKQYSGRRVSFHQFYFGQNGSGHPVFGRRWGCGWWRGGQGHWEPEVKRTFCPSADTVFINRIHSHDGNKCGYNYYVMACETLGR